MSFKDGYIYFNDNGKGLYYYALWIDDLRDICDDPSDTAALPAKAGCAHVSLLKAWMPDEARATFFAEGLKTHLTNLKGKKKWSISAARAL